jgi:hypothetical protein
MQNATGTTCSIIKKGAQVPLHPEITAEDPFKTKKGDNIELLQNADDESSSGCHWHAAAAEVDADAMELQGHAPVWAAACRGREVTECAARTAGGKDRRGL